ncbi:glycoside hydrolase family 16 protein [Pseudarthrobacter albicanus]|uniref:glycoside hydrolase family 16 protein n=1 Tax=Pseudarthrobacter albicanus TaxID=2823873 RepID=UPI001FE2C037|nr:glycoside hydrolase family 16 protein [Pseudarthrobacter albicanus]
MPVGDLPGWRQVFAGDFTHGDVPVGAFPGPAYSAKWSPGYGDGTPDTAGQVSGGKSGYYPSKVLSVKNGVLDWYLHSENGISMGAAPAPIIANTSAGPHRPNSQLYGRYSVRFKADSLKGFKTAWLMWPDSGVWPMDGELDYPEGDLAGTFFGAVHRSGSTQNVFDVVQSNALFASWHTATTEWTAGRVVFFLDGTSIGSVTTGTPVKPMHYILQTESCLPDCPLPTAAGHVQVAWVAVWSKV